MADNDDEDRGCGEEAPAANRSGPDWHLSSHAPGRCAVVVPTEGATTRQPRRIIKLAFVEGVGPISHAELLGMTDHEWGALRKIITDQRQGQRKNLAHCLMWRGIHPGVPIRRASTPAFSTLQGGDETSPWFSGRTLHPNEARAAQYQGQQESYAHRCLCNEIARLALLDARFTSAVVSEYLPPTENAYGRRPDVLPTRNDGWRIAIEIQLSNTFRLRFRRAASTTIARAFRCFGCSAG
jgi:hypothetical protein